MGGKIVFWRILTDQISARLPQVSYIINLVIVPWRIVWVCLDRQDATSQAPLMLAKGGPLAGFGVYDGQGEDLASQREDKSGHSGDTQKNKF